MNRNAYGMQVYYRSGCNGIGQTGLWIVDGGGKRQDEAIEITR